MKMRSNEHLLVELDGGLFQLGKSNGKRLARATAVEGDKWLLSDLQGGMSRLATVEAPPRYAELVMQRRLQESGDVEGQAQVFSHWKIKRGQTASDIFYTAVSASDYSSYVDRAQDDPNQHLVFALGSLLYSVLKQQSKRATVAVLFEHDRHVDFVVGRSGRVFGANRVSTYSTAAEAKAGLEDSVAAELQNIERSEGVKIERLVYFNWLLDHGEGTSSWVEPLAAAMTAKLLLTRSQVYALADGESVTTSLPQMVRYLDSGDAISSQNERLQYAAQRLVPAAAMLAGLAVAGLLGTAGWFAQQAASIEADARQLRESTGLASLETVTADPKYADTLALAADLARLRNVPSFKGILGDLSQASRGNLEFTNVKVSYDEPERASIDFKGVMVAPFPQAKQDHLEFINALRGQGYQIVDSSFSTDVERLEFVVKMEKEVRL